MEWMESESFWLICPDFTDIFVGCEVLGRLQASSIIVCGDEVAEIAAKGGSSRRPIATATFFPLSPFYCRAKLHPCLFCI